MDNTRVIISGSGSVKQLPVIFSWFPDGETHCLIEDVAGISGQSVLIVHRLYPDQNEQIIRLLLLIDLLKDLDAASISLYCPYLPYSRQDKRHLPGEALGAHMVARLLAKLGCACLYTLDCHFMRGECESSYEGLRMRNISVSEKLLAVCRQHIGDAPLHVIGPDDGSRLLTGKVGSTHMHKTRGAHTSDGTICGRNISDLSADHLSLTHPTVVIVDDIVSTGGTMLRAAEQLKERGVEQIHCVVTHGLFLKDSFDQLSELASSITVSDSVLREDSTSLVEPILHEFVLPDWSKTSVTQGP